MKQTGAFLLLIAVAVLFASARPKIINTQSKDINITIEGTSNLHNWSEKVEQTSGIFDINWNADGTFNLDAANIKIAVKGIKSSHSGMNSNTYEALKGDAHPEITFVLSMPLKNIPAMAGPTVITLKGSLTIAGVSRIIGLAVKVSLQGNRRLLFEGSQTIRMTDYNVDPPTAMLGALKTGNEVKVNFRVGVQ